MRLLWAAFLQGVFDGDSGTLDPRHRLSFTRRGEPYKELSGDYFIERREKDAYQRRLVKQLERMAYEVALTKHAA
jgi:hypothetical protein